MNGFSCLYADFLVIGFTFTLSDAITLGTSQRNSSLGDITCVDVAGTLVTLSNADKLLGVTLDSNLTFSKHLSSVCQASYYHIRALRHISHAVSDDTAKSIGQALVSSRLDYANGVLYGISKYNTAKLQRAHSSCSRRSSGSIPYQSFTSACIIASVTDRSSHSVQNCYLNN